jgi:hypothetical protein
LYDAPDLFDNPKKTSENIPEPESEKDDIKEYKDDLEGDFLRFLGKFREE